MRRLLAGVIALIATACASGPSTRTIDTEKGEIQVSEEKYEFCMTGKDRYGNPRQRAAGACLSVAGVLQSKGATQSAHALLRQGCATYENKNVCLEYIQHAMRDDVTPADRKTAGQVGAAFCHKPSPEALDAYVCQLTGELLLGWRLKPTSELGFSSNDDVHFAKADDEALGEALLEKICDATKKKDRRGCDSLTRYRAYIRASVQAADAPPQEVKAPPKRSVIAGDELLAQGDAAFAEKNWSAAERHYRAAVQQGNWHAGFQLYDMVRYAKGVKANHVREMELARALVPLLRSAAAAGDPHARLYCAMVTGCTAGDQKLAWLESAAAQGLWQAMELLYSHYGYTEPKNPVLAGKWAREFISSARNAAESGDPEAQFRLGVTLLPESGTQFHPTEEKEALRWLNATAQSFTPAAQAGNAHAQFRLGMIIGTLAQKHPYGSDARRNSYREAARWFERAGEAGYLREAAFRAGLIYEIDLENFSKAREMVNKQAEYASLAQSPMASGFRDRLHKELAAIDDSESSAKQRRDDERRERAERARAEREEQRAAAKEERRQRREFADTLVSSINQAAAQLQQQSAAATSGSRRAAAGGPAGSGRAAGSDAQRIAATCDARCAGLKAQCERGGQSACYRAAACTCQCFLDEDDGSPSRARWHQCVADNTARADALRSNATVYDPNKKNELPAYRSSGPSGPQYTNCDGTPRSTPRPVGTSCPARD